MLNLFKFSFDCLGVQATLSAMQLSRLHSSTQAPVTARVLLRRSSSRRLLPSTQEASVPPLERRPSLIPTIPEVVPPERRAQFRRRNVMSLVSENVDILTGDAARYQSACVNTAAILGRYCHQRLTARSCRAF